MACTLPPAGWSCTRVPGHDGPCAAVPVDKLTPLLDKLEKLLAKATPGPWESDHERNEDGAYGSGPDHGTGYDDFLIGAEVRGKWATLLTSENATEKLIDEDYDEDYHRAWDRVGEANVALVVEAVNALPVLIAGLRQKEAE
jgi:hypothetical protein